MRNQSAFTLIELLVTVSLMVLFTAGAALYNRGGDKQISLYREQGKVINQLYRVRSLAITTFDRFTDDAQGAPCGYGISIPDNGASLIIFKDMPLADDSCPVYYQNSPQFIYDGGDEFVEEVILKDELDQIGKDIPTVKIVYTVTQPNGTDWSGETGRICKEMIEKYNPNWKDSLFYMSGPPDMVDTIQQIVKEMGVPQEQIKTERFTGY